ncbi:MAG: hypothetical protein CTY31_06285 [Hyphomicrobium sp.]|nr:MAG: hypothetical protein CTY31_06285 [Hyphomicrobium sp.]
MRSVKNLIPAWLKGPVWYRLERRNKITLGPDTKIFSNGKFGTPGRRKLVLAGHEATRTGAPLILLELAKNFSSNEDLELLLFLERGGPLVSEYAKFCTVIINNNYFYKIGQPRVADLIHEISEPRPVSAIVNSAETWRLSQQLHESGLFIISLIHENMARYQNEALDSILDNSARIIFPAEALKQVAINTRTTFDRSEVLPQGLLRPNFGQRDKYAAILEVRNQLNISQEKPIVLACGTRDLRKGFDIFHQVARAVIAENIVRPHFLWLGGSTSRRIMDRVSVDYWLSWDKEVLDLGNDISHIDEVPDPELFFLAADAFILTSRDDPFPCVVHEAMSAKLPVIAFDRAGGSAEALADGAGIIVPYLDVTAMANAVTTIILERANANEMIDRAEKRVRQTYNFENYASKIRNMLHEAEVQHPNP